MKSLITRIEKIERKIFKPESEQKTVVTILKDGEKPPRIEDENVLHIIVSKD